MHRPTWDNLVAAVWGLGEGTVFFIVPDVWLTWLALRDFRSAVVACLWSVAGALVGGAIMYSAGQLAAEDTIALVERVPAISPALVKQAAEQLNAYGYGAMFVGAFSGSPYKVYAVLAGAGQMGLPWFLTVSIPARLLRFLLLVGVVSWLCRRPLAKVPLGVRRGLHLSAWTVFYIWYFAASH